MSDPRLQEWPKDTEKPNIDLKQTEIDFIRKYKPNIAIHIEKVLNDMRIKKRDLFQCLKNSLFNIPIVLLDLILDYQILV